MLHNMCFFCGKNWQRYKYTFLTNPAKSVKNNVFWSNNLANIKKVWYNNFAL